MAADFSLCVKNQSNQMIQHMQSYLMTVDPGSALDRKIRFVRQHGLRHILLDCLLLFILLFSLTLRLSWALASWTGPLLGWIFLRSCTFLLLLSSFFEGSVWVEKHKVLIVLRHGSFLPCWDVAERALIGFLLLVPSENSCPLESWVAWLLLVALLITGC